ncbi:IS21 family transposase [Desulfurivibrio alkaliphilus]|uniref:Integrase catalytic region n=1 Tax=Desulfurivibrio alkaliphilus (strain DSM 19089 / UNIQEM U267 / AHT2) TaxID=589865 RepID=D6Z5L7_DESAT|nr:IS21 family transposase [Desulfurivibrio alkaliphilus]ADH86754.1 Integrase catalytic region [Desulfurivibrio alkaliphilus AHT 2]
MIHKIKALHGDGGGLSVRAIALELGVSRNTVRKYLRLDEAAISQAQVDRARHKRLDMHRSYIIYLLETYPRLSAVKVARKLREKVSGLAVSDRSIRRYVSVLKETGVVAQKRYYEPIIDHVPGVQCQVDPGELRGVLVGGEPQTLYFVVFVLSFSRLMYVGLSFEPIDTGRFIQLHDEAFRYFGGVTEECVYDQTKLVVIEELYRELTLNQRFAEYAATVGMRVHACEGYDPESKGKVEAGVKYVKQNCLYGETFSGRQDLRRYVRQWLDEVANQRTHGTTGQVPRHHFETEEQAHLHPYLTPAGLTVAASERRKVDKTGLISWRANRYSVPMAYQGGQVGVQVEDGQLQVIDLGRGEKIASHTVCLEKGQIIKNTHHYRDHSQRLQELEGAVCALLGQPAGERLCQVLKSTSPRIYKDQLVAAVQLLKAEETLDQALVDRLAQRPTLTATTLKRYLDSSRRSKERGRDSITATGLPDAEIQLGQYASLTAGHGDHPFGQEVNHGCH